MLKHKFTISILFIFILIFGISDYTTKSASKSTDKIQLPILMYHKVNPSSKVGGLGLRVLPGEFDWQMGYLYKNGYQALTMEEGYQYLKGNLKIDGKPIIVTFDDGYKDNYIYAYPILKKYNFTGNIFLISNIIGKTNVWDEKNGMPTNYIMNWDEIDELKRAGIYFGAHTANHPKLAKVSKEVAWQEIKESKDDLEAHFKEKIDYFCYPFGSYNKEVEELVKKAGYKASLTVDQGINKKTNIDFYALKRIRIMGSFSREHFVELLSKYN